MRSRRFRYQDPDCSLTLRQGLEEYYAGHPGLLQDAPDPETRHFFYSHDACHVLFGLDTTLTDEGLADLWTLFGSNMGLGQYVRYFRTDPAAKQILRDIGWWRMIGTTIRVLPLLGRVFLRSRKMRKKWEWGGEGRYLERPLRELRHEFNIHVL